MPTALREKLIHNKPLRQAVQIARVARTVQPPARFVADLARGAEIGQYSSKRTGQKIALRPRLDLQVAREQISKDGYAPPTPAAQILERRSLRILDLGANIGLFTLNALARYGAGTTVTAVEPDPDNLRVLRRNVAINGYDSTVAVIAAAAGTHAGTVRFANGRREISRIATGDEDGIAVETVDAFALASGHDLMKVDIEGGEWPILRDPRLADLDARVLVMEWHTRGSDSDAPAEDAGELLCAAGYTVQHQPRDAGSFVGELWAWRG